MLRFTFREIQTIEEQYVNPGHEPTGDAQGETHQQLVRCLAKIECFQQPAETELAEYNAEAEESRCCDKTLHRIQWFVTPQ